MKTTLGKLSATTIVLLALCSHAWSPHPQVGFFGFCFCFLGAFHVTSISVFISYLFHFQVYHGKCTDFFVNNVLGFAKKENKQKKNPFEFALE